MFTGYVGYLGRTTRRLPFTALLIGLAPTLAAQESTPPSAPILQEVWVTGNKEDLRTLAGSATLLEREAIAQFDATDVNDLMGQVPGVYIRFEDGYGLRPNIGIRGATSERSQKITLMEDGILIAPAPYTAPAAYYLPNINRMQGVEVFKGPAAIHYGPHTVGGAVNMVTPVINDDMQSQLSATYGTDNYQKYYGFFGNNFEQFGYWVDALHYSADGFKRLDGGGDTGFARNDLNAKLQWRTDASATIQQTLDMKLGFADEDSNETYLGLTESDFQRDPTRRYRASQLDRFVSEHSQIHLLHSADFGNGWQSFAKAYLQRFDRSWNKFDGFISERSYYQTGEPLPPAAVTVLADPDTFSTEIGILRGEINSSGDVRQMLDITDNDRTYGSRGLELEARYALQSGPLLHNLAAGIRYHHDYVDRNHTARGYNMQDGVLVATDIAFDKAQGQEQTDAVALFISDEIEYDLWKYTLGLRLEQINSENADGLSSDYLAVIPGVGVFYQWTDELGLLLGVNKGFSPSGPPTTVSVDGAVSARSAEPEESINYEYGFRYQRELLTLDAIGFFSDYSNLLGRCRESDAGCDTSDEFNGGEVQIAGVELSSSYSFSPLEGLTVPMGLVYTYTESAFQTSFNSDFSQWGLVRKGDELPYTPSHQGRVQIGLEYADFAVDLAVKHIGTMREEPGRDTSAGERFTEAYTTVDLAGNWAINDQLSVQLVGENLTNEQVIVARRPFGARPNQPRMVKAGVSYRF